MYLIGGLTIPFLGTTLGAAMVFLMRGTINPRVEKLLLGFALIFAAVLISETKLRLFQKKLHKAKG